MGRGLFLCRTAARYSNAYEPSCLPSRLSAHHENQHVRGVERILVPLCRLQKLARFLGGPWLYFPRTGFGDVGQAGYILGDQFFGDSVGQGAAQDRPGVPRSRCGTGKSSLLRSPVADCGGAGRSRAASLSQAMAQAPPLAVPPFQAVSGSYRMRHPHASASSQETDNRCASRTLG